MNGIPFWSPQSLVGLTRVSITGEVYGPVSKIRIRQYYVSEEDDETGILFKYTLKNELGTITDIEVEVGGEKVSDCLMISSSDDSVAQTLVPEDREQILSNVYEGQVLLVSLRPVEAKKEIKITVSYVTELKSYLASSWKLTIPIFLNEEIFGGGGEEEEEEEEDQEEEESEYQLVVDLHVSSGGEDDLVVDSPTHKNIDILFEGKKMSLVKYREKETFYNQYFILTLSSVESNLALSEVDQEENKKEKSEEQEREEQEGRQTHCVFTFQRGFACPPIPIEIVLMIDCSTSSGSGRLQFLRKVITYCVKNLPTDSMFNVITYGSTYDKFFATSVQSTEASINKACAAVEHEMSLSLGNEQDLKRPLLDVYASTIHNNRERQIFIFSTSGKVSNFSDVILTIQKYSHNTRVFTIGIGKQTDHFLLQRISDAGGGRSETIDSLDFEPVINRQLRRASQPRIIGELVAPPSIPSITLTTSTSLTALFFDVPILVYCSLPEKYLLLPSFSQEKVSLNIYYSTPLSLSSSFSSYSPTFGDLVLTDSRPLENIVPIDRIKRESKREKVFQSVEKEQGATKNGIIKNLFGRSLLKELEVNLHNSDDKAKAKTFNENFLSQTYHLMTQSNYLYSKKIIQTLQSPDQEVSPNNDIENGNMETITLVLSMYFPPLRYVPPIMISTEETAKIPKKSYDYAFLLQYKQHCTEPPEGFPDTPITTGKQKNNERRDKSHRKGRDDRGGRHRKNSKRNEKKDDTPPVPPLPVSENRWVRPSRNDSSASEITRKAQGILNKLTLETFDALSSQLIDLGFHSPECLEGVIHQLFNKAVSEPNFSSMYADLCVRLATAYGSDKGRSQKNFRYILLGKCQSQFETQPIVDFPSSMEDWEREEIERKQRKRAIGNVKFIGELYKHKIISATIIHYCIQKLLENQLKQIEKSQQENDDEKEITKSDEENVTMKGIENTELNLETLSQLLKTVGSNFEIESKSLIQELFDKLEFISKDKSKPSRIRFMLQDLIDLRNNNWVTRRKEDDPKLISEIHREAQLEEERMEWESRNLRRDQKKESSKSSSFDDSDFTKNKSTDSKRGGRIPGSTSPDGWTEVPSRNRLDSKGRKDSDTNLKVRIERKDAKDVPKPRSGTYGTLSNASSSTSPSISPSTSQPQSPKKQPEKILEKKSPQFTSDEFEEKLAPIIDELLQSHDVEESTECIRELNSPEHNSIIISKTLSDALEKTEKDHLLLLKWFSHLYTNNIISSSEFRTGFEQVIELLEDIEIDTPFAPKIISKFLANGLVNGSLPPSQIQGSLGSQVSTGKAFTLLLEILIFAIEQSCLSDIKEKWERGGINASEFLPSSKKDNVNELIKKHHDSENLSFLGNEMMSETAKTIDESSVTVSQES